MKFFSLITRTTGLFISAVLFMPAVQAQSDAVAENIRESLMATQSGMVIRNVEESPVAGMYMVTLDNLQTIFVSEDARFFIPGELFEMSADGTGMFNRSEEMRNLERTAMIADVPESEMIIFPAKGDSKATLSVFTDVDCPYCRRLHGDVEQLNEMGITVRYMAFPREGLDTPTYQTMVSTWCSDDRTLYFDIATRGGEVPQTSCESPVARQYQLGRRVGVEGTPALVFEDGTIVNGYIPAETLGGYLLADQN